MSYKNLIILNVGVYCYFVGGWSGSGVTFMMLQLFPAYKEQLVDYYGVSILTNLINLAVQVVFYCFYDGVPLFKNYKKNTMYDNLLLQYWHHFPSQPSILLPLIKTPPQRKQKDPQHEIYPICYETKGVQGRLSFCHYSGGFFVME